MAQFRAKKLDLGCYINVRVIRDHTKRKVYEQYETQSVDVFLIKYQQPCDVGSPHKYRGKLAYLSAAHASENDI
ncbi:MAG: hypothetical protein LQ350_002109 [Teloschistes chrysophthalmus]|nr:MAG: hypothetical protein LQ350_002109 [Niorma chrysophthalma]